MSLNATDILKLIQVRHEKDIVVPECKTGATWLNNHLLIFDVWTMKKSWTHPLYTGYEIKVSRQDFLKDGKWQGYLPYCNILYFVCPHGLILPTELPSEVGLLWASKTGSKLFEKKKPIFRDCQPPVDLFLYLLMNRTKITKDTSSFSPREYWEQWIKKKEGDRNLGDIVGKKIREEIQRKIERVRQENEVLKKENIEYANLRKIIKDMGMDESKITSWSFTRTFQQKLNMMNQGVPDGFARLVKETIRHLENIELIISQHTKEDDNNANK